MSAELEKSQLDQFESLLLTGNAVRVSVQDVWCAFAKAFPHRTPGPTERRILVEALRSIEARRSIRLPPENGKRWERALNPAIPTSVDIIRDRSARSNFHWRTFPWHQNLHWVVQCQGLSIQQIEFLRRIHDGFVSGMFNEPAPLKYRSLQLTNDEKLLSSLSSTSLFGPSRLSLELLACLPDALPLAWEAVGDGGRMVIFENAGPFAVARRVLEVIPTKPYDLIAYGGGRSILAALGHIKYIKPQVESIHYVGDLDQHGLDIALCSKKCAKELGLPIIQPATELHEQMFVSAAAFGHPDGWKRYPGCSEAEAARLLEMVSFNLQEQIKGMFKAGRRIPEEVLGPEDLRFAWKAVS